MAEKIEWQSVEWKDGSRYEGLVKDDACHVRGVFKYKSGDKYMGEYDDNMMEGYGVYVWSNGTVYRGQWAGSQMHGCGVKLTRQPNGHLMPEEGEFSNDEWVGPTAGCSVADARRAAAQADVAGQMAAVFELSRPPAAKSEGKPRRTVPVLHKDRREAGQGPLKFLQDIASAFPLIKSN